MKSFKNNKKSKIIAITGGIGSGKSEVSAIISSFGYKVVDFDLISKKIRKKFLIKRKLIKIYKTKDLSLQTKIFFSNFKVKKQIVTLLGPLILKEALKQTKGPIVFWDIPLLVESNLQKAVDFTLFISSNKKTRIKRIKKRSGIDSKTINNIMSQQLSEKDKLSKLIHFKKIKNNGSKKELKKKIINALKDLGLQFD